MIKVVFFDIDGTLLSHRIQDVPASARQALAHLTHLDIKKVVATGRHYPEMAALPVSDIQFDAYITLNGQLCFDSDGKIFYENPLTNTEGILKLFHEKTIPVMLVEREKMYINFINDDVVQAHREISTPLPLVGDYTGNPLYQAMIYIKQDTQDTIADILQDFEVTRWNDNGIDIGAKGGTKMTGIAKYLDVMGYTTGESAAFGDAENDIAMLKYVQHGIAMGNAADAVKRAADYVTADIDDDGIQKGLQHLGLM